MKTINNKKAGFSLVELMVVVAIIGILASIAVPNFLKFQAKAKQSAAKSDLSGLFGAEKTFFAEYNTYHTNLPYIGFVPEGFPLNASNCPPAAGTRSSIQRVYQVGFGANAGAGSSEAGTQVAGGPAFACGTTFVENTAWYSHTVGTPGAAGNTPGNLILSAGTGFTPAALAGVSQTTLVANPNTFVAGAAGVVGSNATRADLWVIDNNKVLSNIQPGI